MLQMPSSTNRHDDAMSLLGTFLLQGWVMTDQLCSETSCSVPLMRSKDGMIQFCVLHDPLPTSNARNASTTTLTDNQGKTTPGSTNDIVAPMPDITTTTTTTTTVSGDTEDDDTIVVVELAKQQRPVAAATATTTTDEDKEFRIKQERREQSSRASQLIGQKMLQRWVLLNDTCPNTGCYAIPLVRHPSNKTMYCVICEQSYQPEQPSTQQQETMSNPHNKSASSTAVSMTHTPLGLPALDRLTKRQKKEEVAVTSTHDPTPVAYEDTITTASFSSSTAKDDARVATESGVRRLTDKLTLLTGQMDQCSDPKELVGLCQSLEACAKALGACASTLATLGV